MNIVRGRTSFANLVAKEVLLFCVEKESDVDAR